jgi:putative DNA primase/helicase
MENSNNTQGKVPENVGILHIEILKRLLKDIIAVDFDSLAFPEKLVIKNKVKALSALMLHPNGTPKTDRPYEIEEEQVRSLKKQLEKFKLTQKHILIIVIEKLLELAETKSWAICRKNSFIYLYNGAFWQIIDKDEFQNFLGEVAEKMGVNKFESKYFMFKEHLFKQFLSTGYLKSISPIQNEVLINLNNGTFAVTLQGDIKQKSYDPNDFLTYQLPFNYDKREKASLFQTYLDKVLPNRELQDILAEYLGYVFIDSSSLKLEKALLLYGSGANGKSVFFEIVTALLGPENISNYTLESLTNNTGYQRAKISNKLVNYASEISGKLEISFFKQLVSGEPVEARLPYGEPFTITKYAKLIFNCNELPSQVEHTDAYFRRFLIIPFNITIPEEEQDKELSKKIIDNELSGVFNWVLAGLERLLSKRNFTSSELVKKQTDDYKKKTDTTFLFLEDENYHKSLESYVLLQSLYNEYTSYCLNSGYRPLGKNKFSERLKYLGYDMDRLTAGNVVYIAKEIFIS